MKNNPALVIWPVWSEAGVLMKNAGKPSTRKKGAQQHPGRTMAGFLERTRQYRLDGDVNFDPPAHRGFPEKRLKNRRRTLGAKQAAQGVTATWKLQDAKTQFSELVRRARAGEPQQVTVHGKPAVVVLDPERFEFRPKPQKEATLAGFVERSKKYRGLGLKLPPRIKMDFPNERNPFDEDDR
ncbi:MAG TPA: type II toxin-antitoxin system Phd/YefM family antitoxin [Xanthobacteraceae bacterium]